MRYICLFCVICVCTGSYVHGFSVNDCQGYSVGTAEDYVTDVNRKYTDQQQREPEEKHELLFFTDKDLHLIFTHFRQFCCKDIIGSENCEEPQPPFYYAQSYYIGDHLIDIGFRKLDGVEDHCKQIGFDCTNRAKVPDIGVEWREKIKKVAEDRKGYPPAYIEELFYTYRGDNDSNPLAYEAVVKKEYEKIDTLRAQYKTLCQEIAHIQEWMDPLAGSDTEYIRATGGKGLYTHCLRMADQRYEQEVAYVRTLMVEKGITFLVENLRAYSLDYFVDNRFNSLSDKYTEMEGCFNTVLAQSTHTACCNE